MLGRAKGGLKHGGGIKRKRHLEKEKGKRKEQKRKGLGKQSGERTEITWNEWGGTAVDRAQGLSVVYHPAPEPAVTGSQMKAEEGAYADCLLRLPRRRRGWTPKKFSP